MPLRFGTGPVFIYESVAVARRWQTYATRSLFVFGLLVALALLATPARAHEMSMAEMEVRETSPGEFLWLWSASSDKRPMGDDLKPRWPDGCMAGWP